MTTEDQFKELDEFDRSVERYLQKYRRLCKEDECDESEWARGMCKQHYEAFMYSQRKAKFQ